MTACTVVSFIVMVGKEPLRHVSLDPRKYYVRLG